MAGFARILRFEEWNTEEGRSTMDRELRIDGWKAIAAHFRRDRTTVMRWAQSRGLPVYRVPGGGSGSVFAYVDELDAWLNRS